MSKGSCINRKRQFAADIHIFIKEFTYLKSDAVEIICSACDKPLLV